MKFEVIENYSQFLQTHIKPWARPASGGRVVNCRCFYCQDSKTLSHGHFYISIPQTNKEPSLFYCQKCKAKGIVTSNKLLDWGIFDSDMAIAITKYNGKVLSLPENMKYSDSIIYRITNDYITDDKLSMYKLNYINNRLGTNLSYQDCIDLKIVLNISDLFKRNKLQYTRDERIITQLDNGFLGFLSHDNAFINMRNLDLIKDIHNSIDKRYVNYNIMGKYDNTCRFYSVPTMVDLCDPRAVQLHIAEGSFDILSIYLNLRKSLDRNIFSAVGGSGYRGLIRYFMNTLRTPNLEIHIYPDNDVNRSKIIDIYEYLLPFKFPFYIHRNVYVGEKDFGVPISRITETIEKVL